MIGPLALTLSLLAAEPAAPLSLEGLIRDERGIRFAPEASD